MGLRGFSDSPFRSEPFSSDSNANPHGRATTSRDRSEAPQDLLKQSESRFIARSARTVSGGLIPCKISRNDPFYHDAVSGGIFDQQAHSFRRTGWEEAAQGNAFRTPSSLPGGHDLLMDASPAPMQDIFHIATKFPCTTRCFNGWKLRLRTIATANASRLCTARSQLPIAHIRHEASCTTSSALCAYAEPRALYPGTERTAPPRVLPFFYVEAAFGRTDHGLPQTPGKSKNNGRPPYFENSFVSLNTNNDYAQIRIRKYHR